jgi:hypothetical protein
MYRAARATAVPPPGSNPARRDGLSLRQPLTGQSDASIATTWWKCAAFHIASAADTALVTFPADVLPQNFRRFDGMP